jgi:hypothetical protein
VAEILVGGLVGAVVGGGLTWLTARWQLRKELEYGYDKELRAERVAVYKELWKLSERLPRYHSRGNPTGSEVEESIENFHQWFFEVGGLFLSDDARKAYFAMMNRLRVVADNRGTARISSQDVNDLFRVGEDLRRQLVFDVGAGRPPELRTGGISPPPSHPRHDNDRGP